MFHNLYFNKRYYNPYYFQPLFIKKVVDTGAILPSIKNKPNNYESLINLSAAIKMLSYVNVGLNSELKDNIVVSIVSAGSKVDPNKEKRDSNNKYIIKLIVSNLI